MIAREKKLFLPRVIVLVILSILTLNLGGIIYILFRPTEPFFFSWIKIGRLGNELTKLRELQLDIANLIPEWIIYSLPNGLWAFSYSILISSIWLTSKSILKYFWFTSVPLLILGYEFLQLTPLVRGTFCWQDILTGIIGILSGTLIGTKIIQIQKP